MSHIPQGGVTSIKKALVLSGGGAKGAYAFGCMQAFKERKIKFDEVAGTSVGALNALIWQTKQMASGERLWSSLSFDSVYPVKPFLRNLPSWAIKVAGGVYVYLRLVRAAAQGYHPPRGALVAVDGSISLGVADECSASSPWCLTCGAEERVGNGISGDCGLAHNAELPGVIVSPRC